ncbi:bifunctional diguanylate cyclase/phosphodiesterase [Aromatoleum diolicum]|uniref:EAL domain-containing protein n=1 Tax=Aromatoleum diolicum TaxID=75796 RepID=A0ABX1QDK5_9RHOO|nr:EAL domain-containing protein [Aromatoleum diolicum]NMG76508.1 EAL domain-containing protein [Aromatoleum diolicum]
MAIVSLPERSALFRPRVIGLAAFLLAAVTAAVLILQSEREARHVRRSEVADLIGDKAHEVENAVHHGLTATYALAALVRQGRGAVPDFEAVATEMLRYYPGADSLQLAPGGIIRRVVPVAENAKAIGHDLLADPARTKEAFLARDTGKLTLAGPFTLMQGGIGAVGRLPVFIDDENGHAQFWGFTTVLIRFPEVLSKAQLPQLVKRGFHYELWRIHPDTGLKQIIAASSQQPLVDAVDRTLGMPNGTWTLSVAPIDGWTHKSDLVLKLLLGLAFSSLLGWLAKQMAELRLHRRRLQVLVDERTAELAAREAKLAALIGSLPDLLFVMDESGRITELHSPDPSLLVAPAEHFLGRSYEESFPAEVAGDIRSGLIAIERDGQRREIEYSLDLPGGQRRFSASMSQLSRLDGGPAGFIALVRDVSERKLAEERMREAMVVFDASSQGIMTADAAGVITSVNPAFCTITGYSVSDVVGQTPAMFKSGRHDDGFYQNMWSTLEKTGRWEGEIWNRRKSGDVYPQWLTISAVRDDAGKLIKYVSIFSDMTRRKQREEVIWRQANFDALTGLANRNLLHDRLERALAHSRRTGKRAGLIFLDLDGFKWINDTLGHDVGDEMLVEVAGRLQECIRQQDTVARLGGDEFTLVVEDIDDAEGLQVIGDKVLRVLRAPFLLAGANRYVSGSLGITVFPDDGDNVQTLLRNADIAMYQSKQLGKNRCQFYAQDMQEAARARVQLEAELRSAIELQQFVLYYQPIIHAASGTVAGAEALIRWRHPERGIVAPGEFIPVAEDTGLIVAIGEWVLCEAVRQSRQWRSQGLPLLRIAVNVSGVQFREAGLVGLVTRLCGEHGLEHSELILEITESVLMQSSDLTEVRMREISALGVGYSLDDFGTGYSSLSYLKRFPVDVVKIDRSFVNDCPDDRNDTLLVEAIINMAHSLGLRVTAEGVETEAQHDFLRARGCDYVQGFLISRPLTADDFEAFARRHAASR